MIPDFDAATGNLAAGCGRATQKAAFLGELFIADVGADPQGTLFRAFFNPIATDAARASSSST